MLNNLIFKMKIGMLIMKRKYKESSIILNVDYGLSNNFLPLKFYFFYLFHYLFMSLYVIHKIFEIILFKVIYFNFINMDHIEYDFLFKYILVGNASVGKSTLLGMFVDNKFRQQNQPTLGVQFASKRIQINRKIVKLQIWDTAGQQSFRTITRAYYKNTIGILLVFDINVRKSFDDLAYWLEQIKQMSNPKAQIVIIGNKIDIKKNEVSQQQIKKLGFKFYQTSAKTGQNVDEPFIELSNKILKRVQNNQIDTSDPKSGVKISTNQNINREVNLSKDMNIKSKGTNQDCSC